jgi:hypothetical protein
MRIRMVDRDQYRHLVEGDVTIVPDQDAVDLWIDHVRTPAGFSRVETGSVDTGTLR